MERRRRRRRSTAGEPAASDHIRRSPPSLVPSRASVAASWFPRHPPPPPPRRLASPRASPPPPVLLSPPVRPPSPPSQPMTAMRSPPTRLRELTRCAALGPCICLHERRTTTPSPRAASNVARRMTHHAKLVDDSGWAEVMFANNYALFIGYLSMAVKGLGFLVLTWTTVVLLGSFGSALQKRDFWCLIFITLVQTAGIFDVFLAEKLSYIGNSFWGIGAVGHMVRSNTLQHQCHGLENVLTSVQLVVFWILLCPLAAVYMFGLLISAGISVWCLRKHDYGSDADGVVNLKPALEILYSLALLQAVIFCYKAIFACAKGSVVNALIEHRGFSDRTRVPISDYVLKMTIGCEKDPSFATGRNLITYAVDLMGSKSPNDYLSGVRTLDAFAKRLETVIKNWEEKSTICSPKELKRFMQEHILMKHLIMSAPSTGVLQKLLQTLGRISVYDRETREGAARIVANIALDIRLEEFPRAIFYISSLIDTFEIYHLLQPYQRNWVVETFEQNWYRLALYLASSDSDKQENSDEDQRQDSDIDLLNSYKELVGQGLRILRKLAKNDVNCRVMLDTPCLLRKIMAPVTTDLLHNIDHGAWYSIVEGSLKVMCQLTLATGQTGKKLRSEISSSKEAISIMEMILECDKCDENVQKQVIWILSNLYQDTSLILAAASREKFIGMLLDTIATDDNKDKERKWEVAAKALLALSSQMETSAMIILKANDNVLANLTTMIVKKSRYRLVAANILKYLCIHYTNDVESRIRLKEAITDAVPKVLGEIFCWASEETHTGTAVDQFRSRKQETDVENQCGDSQYNDQDLAHQFDAINPGDGEYSFPRKLKEFVRKNTHPRPDCLTVVKLACKMFISMMKHRGSYVKEDLESLMDALSSASKCMFLLDGSMVFDITEDGAMTSRPFKSLASLVKEAHELMDKHNSLLS
ncbi:uncharacterized protein LOC100828184 isoform X2 [Brachypodium distachyon]|nr:uncharacterized protein LOC100828184 isoform X2 [Brachypodium distachyon]|eukprot:XP_010231747.2 uncharacterized protein LOC100828184 isoform X2 [Brachypodium distachyon]